MWGSSAELLSLFPALIGGHCPRRRKLCLSQSLGATPGIRPGMNQVCLLAVFDNDKGI